MAKKKKKLEEAVVDEVMEVEAPEMDATIEIKDVCEAKECDGMVQVKITDQFVKLHGIVYKKGDTPYLCKEIVQNAKWCKVL